MNLRELKPKDLTYVQALMNTDSDYVKSLFDNAVKKVLVEEAGREQGFIIINEFCGIKELYWHLKPEHLLVLKSVLKTTKGVFGVHERVSAVERINFLKSLGFNEVRTNKGVFYDEDALTLKRD